MKQPFKTVFGGIVVYVLLILYAGTVYYMLRTVASCPSTASCPASLPFHAGLVSVVTTVGGLVSALVIAKLAVTKPGQNPVVMRFEPETPPRQVKIVHVLAGLYLAVWLIAGLAALVIGVMWRPGVSQTVSDLGTSWLGLAVATGFAYFGIEPSG